jgi:hypothetical protein
MTSFCAVFKTSANTSLTSVGLHCPSDLRHYCRMHRNGVDQGGHHCGSVRWLEAGAVEVGAIVTLSGVDDGDVSEHSTIYPASS